MPATIEILRTRAKIIRAVREFFDNRDFIEVETPHLIPANAPEEYIDPVSSGEKYLHTSPELCMKRLLCRGGERLYQICRCWRNDERGSRHVPEFTMLEWYRAGSDYHDLMQDCEELLQYIVTKLEIIDPLQFRGSLVRFDQGCDQITVQHAFEKFGGILLEEALDAGVFDEILVTRIEPSLPHDRPVILKEYPIELAALARSSHADPRYAERFELYVCGMELANGFSELNDAEEQYRRFVVANSIRLKAGKTELPIPMPFLEELPRLPSAAGIALGIDRLVMLFSGKESIDDVIAFTPEGL